MQYGIVRINLWPEVRRRVIEQLRIRAAEILGVEMPDNWTGGEGDEITLANLCVLAVNFKMKITICDIKLEPVEQQITKTKGKII